MPPQEIQKNTFLIRYSGPLLDTDFLDIKSMEGFTDLSTSHRNVVIRVNSPIRPSSLRRLVELFNMGKPNEESQVVLRGEITTLSRNDGETLQRSEFYRRIREAEERHDPTYFKWPRTLAERKQARVQKALHVEKGAVPKKRVAPKKVAVVDETESDEEFGIESFEEPVGAGFGAPKAKSGPAAPRLVSAARSLCSMGGVMAQNARCNELLAKIRRLEAEKKALEEGNRALEADNRSLEAGMRTLEAEKAAWGVEKALYENLVEALKSHLRDNEAHYRDFYAATGVVPGET